MAIEIVLRLAINSFTKRRKKKIACDVFSELIYTIFFFGIISRSDLFKFEMCICIGLNSTFVVLLLNMCTVLEWYR